MVSVPKISVVMSCYNAGSYLSDAIESVLGQTYGDFELLLIDDGSRDGTLGTINDFAAKDKRIVVIAKENSGLANSLNVGIEAARAQWIARMDQDDIAFPERLQRQIDFMGDHPETVLLGGGCVTIDNKGRELRRYRYPTGHDDIINQIEQGGTAFPHATAFYRRDTVRGIGCYRVRMDGAEDKDLWLRLGSAGRIACLAEPLIRLRKHSDSFTGVQDNRLTILSHTAVISHFLRKNGFRDPVDDEEEKFRSFLIWVEDKLRDARVFDEERLWSDFSRRWRETSGTGTLVAAAAAIRGFVRSRVAMQILRKRFFGSQLTSEIAGLWVTTRLESVGK